ncbi:adenylate/guanylate cyclase domain-containing protein [Pseudoduganella lutea]|uniref:Adenylate/guanylate cyclase domain-containing protein n=1 Tax=Pseudoduganella lutea TaxID=321985 RepID=A0A4V0Z4L3_9BURK|nr:adenylate/guanylate cyclase domain-containing protein [Pseudoduganella lutea]
MLSHGVTASVPYTGSYFGNEWLRDLFLQARKSDAPEQRILVVDIDESSTGALGPWPWPRSRIADLVETLLSHYGVRGVALDIVLPNPADADGDRRLALLSEHGPLVLAQAFDFQQGRPQMLREGQPGGATGRYGARGVPATGFIASHAALSRHGKVGNIGFVPDADGVLRRVPLLTRFEGLTFPALGLALVDCCGTGNHAPLALGRADSARVPYRRDWNAYTVATAAEILAQAYAADAFRDRLVIVGSSSLGQGDRVATPLGSSRPGLGVQAEVLSMLLDMQAGETPRPWPGSLIACLFALAATLLALIGLPRLSALASVALLGGLGVTWLGMAWALSPHDPDFVTTGPLGTLLVLLALAVPYQWQQSQYRARHLLNTLRQYVAPEVVAELLQRDEDDPLKPQAFDVTTLIADMEGYTGHVESLPVEEAARLTRDFLECLTMPVIGHQGTLDKYTGDGLVAFWGAPLPVARHADLALDAARQIVERVGELSRLREQAGHAPLRVRIGIESGIAVAGDFGTVFRSIYTAVGDSVNTASRLEQAARDFPHDVIVGAGTVERARRHRFISLGERILRGKEKPTTLYSLAPENDMPLPSARNATS